MLEDKMIRFLKSIHIENLDDFDDLSFEMASYDRFNRKQFNMVILKKTPWKYHLLRELQDGLNYITYPYTLRFSYLVRPKYKDVIALFEEWYQTLYHIPHNLEISGDENDRIYVKYLNNAEKEQYAPAINDFRDFLNFLSYEFTITETVNDNDLNNEKVEEKVVKEETTVSESEEVIKADENNAKDSFAVEHDELMNESVLEDNEAQTEEDKNDANQEPSKPSNDILDEASNALIKLLEKNAQDMMAERRRARLNKRGNYVHIEKLDDLTNTSGNVDIDGTVFSIESKEYGGSARGKVGLGDDFEGAIYVNFRANPGSVLLDTLKQIQKDMHIRVRGVAYTDDFTHQLAVRAHFIDLLPDVVIEKEQAETPRVELHLHSKMSAMDGVSTVNDYCKYAAALGHKALAITDHAVVQAFPEAQKAAKKYNLKMIYGCEFYMVDEKLNYIKNPVKTPLNSAKYVVLDLETTGLSARYDRMIEFGAVKVENGMEIDRLDILVNPGVKIPKKIIALTGIKPEMLKDKPNTKEALEKIISWIGDAILVTHNAEFDFSFLQEELRRNDMPLLTNPLIDTLSLSRYLFPDQKHHALGNLCRRFEVAYSKDDAHRADYDASVLNEAWQAMIVLLEKEHKGITHEDLGSLESSKELLKHIRPYHVVALAKNMQGIIALNKLVSLSHIDYLADVPKVPRKELEKFRENLIIGSACFNGEVFRTAEYYNKETLLQVMNFYDYIEIQPMDNYSFLWNMDDISKPEVEQYVHDIIECADELGKMVVATSDAHYAQKKDKKYRDVYIFAKGLGNVNHPLNPYARADLPLFDNPNQHYRSTDEMLEEMSFLGKEKAYEIVVTNTNKIADSIEFLVPLPNDKLFPPHIDNCEENLTKMVFDHAKELYGDPLPKIVQDRLDTELNGIINNGFSVIYMIAHLLIKKANEDGHMVGSRGSVGSSLVATMANITEVNSLPPHYRCPKCKHLEWVNETDPDVKSGFDLPEKNCPECGTPMKHDGQNIPFQTFLGFNADKTPDIDLNFPPDYQATAHAYTKVLLGAKNVFRAGTIGTVADKTAYGHVRNYLEKIGINPDDYSSAKTWRLAAGCTDVKRTTGQHPGGIVVIPDDHEVYEFTAVQYPADDKDAEWKTTHIDYHSIDNTVLKLDMLGHVDPLALKMMEDLTKVKIEDIPMNDPKVLSLFSSTSALGIKNDYLQNKTGALAIPEFGTETTRRVLEKTLPTKFSDLVIISGLSHGTGVWAGNAEKLIDDGVATLREVIGCRDDIMTYLISKGLPQNISFKIMEDVRKGRGLKPEYVELMLANNVPQYYIDSCKLIQYMFPKGHAVAYVTQAVRVGYYKIYYPLEFYATFFSVRTDQYDIRAMIKGKSAIIAKYEELKAKEKDRTVKMTAKDKELIVCFSVAIEMVERGYYFENIDLYRSDATHFVIDYEKKALIPPFITLEGLGENNAVTVIEARKEKEFTSKEDLLRRTKLTTTNVEALSEMGVLDSLDETDQLSLFDF